MARTSKTAAKAALIEVKETKVDDDKVSSSEEESEEETSTNLSSKQDPKEIFPRKYQPKKTN